MRIRIIFRSPNSNLDISDHLEFKIQTPTNLTMTSSDFMISPLVKANMKRRALGGSCADIIEGWCKLQTPLGGLFFLIYVFEWSVVDSHVQRECIIGDSLLFYFYFLLPFIIECATTHVIRIIGNGGRGIRWFSAVTTVKPLTPRRCSPSVVRLAMKYSQPPLLIPKDRRGLD